MNAFQLMCLIITLIFLVLVRSSYPCHGYKISDVFFNQVHIVIIKLCTSSKTTLLELTEDMFPFIFCFPPSPIGETLGCHKFS